MAAECLAMDVMRCARVGTAIALDRRRLSLL
jgi:hypothetical protein